MASIEVFANSFTELDDTPSSFAGGADEFVRVNPGETALVFFDLFGTANTWNATQTFRDIAADADGTRNIGTGSVRFRSLRAQIAVGTVGNGTVTFPAGQGGGIFGRSQGAGSSLLFGTLATFPPVVLGGNAYSVAGSTAIMSMQAGGGSMFGSAFTYVVGGSSVIETTPTAYGCFVGGYAFQSGGAGTSRILAAGAGMFLWGYAAGTGTGTQQVTGSGAGSFCAARTGGAGAHAVRSNGDGSFAQGIALGASACLLETTAAAPGGFAQGRVNNGGTIRASNSGAFAQGNVQNGAGIIVASGAGAFAQGNVTTTGNITASGAGSFAHGQASTGTISATAAGAFAAGDAGSGTISATAQNAGQFGVGTNSQADSWSVGTTMRLKGTTGAPTTPRNGDIWVDASGFMTFQSAGVAQVLSRPTITGSRGGNAALASLLSALAGMNVIVDATTA